MSGDGPAPALSLVVPVYNEEDNVAPLHAELGRIASDLARSYEIVFVNDGSRDRTLRRLEALAAADPHLRIVDLDGNFGEAAALSAGFAHARGAVIVTLDGDGQNDPADIPRLLARLEDGFDVVSGRRVERREAFVSRVLPSRIANWLIARATGVPVYDCGCGLKVYRREVVAGAQLPRGMNRFLPAILGVDPSRVAEVPVQDRPRGGGQSNYGLERVFIVCRDLVALPLLVRRRPRSRALARALGTTGAALAGVGVVALVSALVRPATRGMALAGALATLCVAVTGRAIGHNLDRFVTAQEEGVFRVRRVV